jgi:hypothetical protein
MKANEMRIGNWYDENGATKQVNPNTIEAVWVAERIWCKPIPLTEEWLLKFGFITKGVHYNFTLENIEIASAIRVISTNERGKFYLDGDIPEWMKIKLEYVHQLQNLYFALTGEEITIGGNNE